MSSAPGYHTERLNQDEAEQGDRGLFEEEETPKRTPHSENYWDMMRLTLFPKLHWFSFCSVIVIFEIFMFLVQIFVDGVEVGKGKAFLEVNSTGPIIIRYAKLDVAIRKDFQYYRLFTSLVLHGSFDHLFGNTLSTLIWGTLIENKIGRLKTGLIYLAAGGIGNLFAMIFTKKNEIGLGASTSIYGFFGILIGLVILNWNRMPKLGYNHQKVLLTLLIIIFLNIMTLGGGTGVDHYAHAGGFIAGLTLGLTFADLDGLEKGPLTPYESKVKKFGLLATAVFFVGSLLIYYIHL